MLNPLTWSEIETGLEAMKPATGGFSQARRGLVTLRSGAQVFVKIGTDENSKEWAKKEVAVYRYLKANSFTAIPELLCTNADETAFALEALTAKNGWDWSDSWTDARLAATLRAMDDLVAFKPVAEEWMLLGQLALDESRDGWRFLAQSSELQQNLLAKLRKAGYTGTAHTLDFKEQAKHSSHFVFKDDAFVHHDVRADNCAWNPATRQVKLVDWNWAQLGDRRIDAAAMLVHVQKSGLSVYPAQAARLDTGALQWLAGFWLKAATTPIWPGGPAHLRDFQLQSGVTALGLADKVAPDN